MLLTPVLHRGVGLVGAFGVGKGGVKFIVHWLDVAVYPVLMQIVCLDALEVAHEMDKAFFRTKWEHVHGMSLEKVRVCHCHPNEATNTARMLVSPNTI